MGPQVRILPGAPETLLTRVAWWLRQILTRPESGFTTQLYVKNLFNKSPITGFFVNSDDNGLTTNVFTPDPRIIGFSMSKRF